MSTIATNTITNVAGNSTGVGIAVSNAATYNSEGGAVTQNLVQGVAKAFHGQANQSSGAFASGASTHNISSYTDIALGRSRLNLTNAMVNTAQSVHGSCTAYDYGHFMASTTIYEIGAVNSGGSFADASTFGAIFGDLA